MKENILMVANWKMKIATSKEALNTFTDIKKTAGRLRNVQTVVCPSDLHNALLSRKVTGHRCVLGGQNCHWQEVASQTGETSVMQLNDLGNKYCIVGHSERRAAGETNEEVSLKINSLLKRDIQPILCIGEAERDKKGKYLYTIVEQLKASLFGVSRSMISKVIVAYEPLWAIGKNAKRAAAPREIQEMVIHIKRTLADMYKMKSVPKNDILYGGSVSNEKEVKTFYNEGGVDGFLVGRASLDSRIFNKLLKATQELVSKK
jgi:triosephosphate isomerase